MSDPVSLDRYRNSRRLVWFAMWAAILMTVAVIAHPSPEAAQVVTVVAPTLLGLAAGWSGIANWAEVKHASMQSANTKSMT